jgi:flagellar protein FliO/FliZ
MTRPQHVAATAAASSFALVSSSAWSQVATTAATTATTPATSASPVFGMMQGVFGLLIVIGLIFAAGWLLRRIGPRARSGNVVQVLGGASVGPREKVVVVRYGDQTLVLGVAPGHVGLLHTAPASAAVEPPAVNEVVPSFVDRLRSARGGE